MLREVVGVVIVAQITLQNAASKPVRMRMHWTESTNMQTASQTRVMQRVLAAYQQQLNTINSSCWVDILSNRACMALIRGHKPCEEQRCGFPHLVLCRC
jgi:hypothetical protein